MNYGQIVGVGNTATVYEWEKGKVLKLFNKGYPKDVVEKEFENAKAISNFNFGKVNAYDLVFLEDRFGIIFDRVCGESLLDWVLKTGNVKECAEQMAKLHKAILKNKIKGVQNYKELLKYFILNTPAVKEEEKKVLLHGLEKLRNGDVLCHGDFHPGNIFICDGNTIVIDYMNVCQGDYLYDIARTVFLVEFTPVPLANKNRDVILQFKKSLSDLYLIQMNIQREMIQDYLSVIRSARLGECPNEQLI